MTRPIPARHLFLAAVGALALAGCGNAPDAGTGLETALQSLRQVMAAPREGAAARALQPTPGFPGLDPALIAGRSDPMMGAVLPARGAVAGLTPVALAARPTWRTADGVSLTLVGGGLVASTRGLGADLDASDVAASAALIEAGRGGTARRRHIYRDALYRPVTLVFDCTIAPVGPEVLVLNGQRRPVLRLDERCAGAGLSFTNSYWRDARGPLIRQSTQWLGPELGVIHLQRLID
jgi:hypothetical protein